MPNNIKNKLVFKSDFDINLLLSEDEEGNKYFDFNKIIPMPEGLEANPHSGIETWVKIVTGQLNFKSMLSNAFQNKSPAQIWNEDQDNNGFDNMLNYMDTSCAFEYLLGERTPDVSGFSDEDFDTFVQCLKNYRKYKYISWYEWRKKNWGTKWNSYENEIKENEIMFETANGVPLFIYNKLHEIYPDLDFEFEYSDEDSGNGCGYGFIKDKELEVIELENGSQDAIKLYLKLHPDNVDYYELKNGIYIYKEEE